VKLSLVNNKFLGKYLTDLTYRGILSCIQDNILTHILTSIPEVFSLIKIMEVFMENVLNLEEKNSNNQIAFNVHHMFNAGFSGSDQKDVQKHVSELAKLGIPAPNTIPMLFPVSNNLATTSQNIQVQHSHTSGEIEYVLLWGKDDIYITVGSDHTDRLAEKYGIPLSKQVYPNILASSVWPFSDIKDHFDQIEILSWVNQGNSMVIYQKGKLGDLMSPEKWVEHFNKMNANNTGNVFFSGTIDTKEGTLVFGDRYILELNDPVLNRSIKHEYSVEVLQTPIL